MDDVMMSLQEVQEACTSMLKDVSSACERNNIEYYVIYGTLLGTIRHSGPIPWDYDVDIYVPFYEIDRLIRLVESELSDKYWVDFRQNGSLPKEFPRIGLKGFKTNIIHIDVFRMSWMPNNKILRILMTRTGHYLRIIRRLRDSSVYNNKDKLLKTEIIKIISAPLPTSFIIAAMDKMCGLYKKDSTNYAGRMMGDGAIFKSEYFESYIMKPYADFYVRVPIGYEKLLMEMYGDYMCYPPEAERLEPEKHMYFIEHIC